MRILWLSHFIPFPPRGGAPQRSYHLLREAGRRHEVHLVTLAPRAGPTGVDGIAAAERALGGSTASFTWFPIPADRSRWRWWTLVATTGLRSAPYDVTWLASGPMHRHVSDLADRIRFDLIHADTIGLWPYAAPRGPTPVVLNHHNIESQMMARRAQREPHLARRVYFRAEARKLAGLEREAGPAAALNLVVSELDAVRLREAVPTAHCRVVDNGVDTAYFRPAGTPPVPGSLVFAGTLDWYPNREAVRYFLREIWPLVRDSAPDSTVTFVGRNPPTEATDSGDARVRAPGFVDDARPFLDAGEIYVCPIRDGGGTRLKILDALAMEKPVVATGLAVEGLALVDGEHYARAETPAAFAAEIRRLRDDAGLRRRLGENGRRLVETRYRWALVGASLNQAYEQATARATR